MNHTNLQPNHEKLREEWNKAFPPPTLLGQNQERVADFWLSKLSEQEVRHQEEMKKEYQRGLRETAIAIDKGNIEHLKHGGQTTTDFIRELMSVELEELAVKIENRKVESTKKANNVSSDYFKGVNAGLRDAVALIRSLKDKKV